MLNTLLVRNLDFQGINTVGVQMQIKDLINLYHFE